MPRRSDVFSTNWRTGEPLASPHPRPSDRSVTEVISDITLGTLGSSIDYIVGTLPKGPGEGPEVVYQFHLNPKNKNKIMCQ
jgi:hypothetical protein